jgi:transposase
MRIDATTDGNFFYQYTVRILVPELRPVDIAVLDKLRNHRQQHETDTIGAIGYRLGYLPPYSPNFNPIEKMRSKVKAILRKLSTRASKALDEAIRIALESITSPNAAGWLPFFGDRIS